MKLLSDRGQGSPLALVCALMCDEELFAGQADRLARRRRLLIFQSEGEESVRECAIELLAMLGALGLRRFDLGGLSLGGSVVMAAAARCPSAVKRLLLLDTTCEAPGAEAVAARREVIRRLEEGRFEQVMEEFLPRLLAPQSLRDHGERVRAMFRRQAPGLFVRQLRLLLTREDMGGTLRAFAGPALCLCGAQDQMSTPADHRRMAELMPAASLVVVPGNCGHLSALESPRLVAEAMEDFLGEV
ncbi:MAG: alpha/beta hydrolase [bacterium]|nr:alpha/beta hydrolase [bacterium]